MSIAHNYHRVEREGFVQNDPMLLEFDIMMPAKEVRDILELPSNARLNYYSILGLKSLVQPRDEDVFQRQLEKYWPKVAYMHEDAEVAKLLSLMQLARDTLSDKKKKVSYDTQLKEEMVEGVDQEQRKAAAMARRNARKELAKEYERTREAPSLSRKTVGALTAGVSAAALAAMGLIYKFQSTKDVIAEPSKSPIVDIEKNNTLRAYKKLSEPFLPAEGEIYTHPQATEESMNNTRDAAEVTATPRNSSTKTRVKSPSNAPTFPSYQPEERATESVDYSHVNPADESTAPPSESSIDPFAFASGHSDFDIPEFTEAELQQIKPTPAPEVVRIPPRPSHVPEDAVYCDGMWMSFFDKPMSLPEAIQYCRINETILPVPITKGQRSAMVELLQGKKSLLGVKSAGKGYFAYMDKLIYPRIIDKKLLWPEDGRTGEGSYVVLNEDGFWELSDIEKVYCVAYKSMSREEYLQMVKQGPPSN